MEYLLAGGHVLTLDADMATMKRRDVHIRGGKIVTIAETIAVQGAERIDVSGMLLSPGLVDTHWHMWNSLARGFSMSRLGPFAKTMAALAKAWTPEASALSVKLAMAEAVQSGITTVNNWAHNTKGQEFAAAELAAMQESGVRGRFSYGYPQALKPGDRMDFSTLERFQASNFQASRKGLIHLGLCTRGPDRTEPSIWQEEWSFARDHKIPITTHIASDRAAGAMGNIAKMAAAGHLGPDVQLVHATHASEQDFKLIAEAGSPLSISPWSELEVGYGIPPVAAIAAAGVKLGLSVDNMVLAGNADMFAVMKLTADIAVGQAEKQGQAGDAIVLNWATATGAETLGLGGTTGTLAPGKRADVIAIRMDALNTVASMSPAFLMTHAAQPGNVDLVMIDGVVHKRHGKLTRIDADELTAQADAMMADLRRVARL